MKRRTTPRLLLSLLLLLALSLSSFRTGSSPGPKKFPRFPYQKAGLTERQAAAHLLSRFTFGARPGQVDQVVKMGLEKWFLQQLAAGLPDGQLEKRLAAYPTLAMSNEQILQTYPRPGAALRQAIRDGVIDKDAAGKDAADKNARQEYRQKLEAYMQQKGYKPQADLYRELINQKILRATYSENQLQEVLTSFWFNHFNVSLTDNDCSRFIPAYERDVIRPNVLGKFETLLLATAKSPAMLTYLDNFKSAAAPNTALPGLTAKQQQLAKRIRSRMAADTSQKARELAARLQNAQKGQGLNENYAREIMELHTLGVDGGYTQADVTQAARVLTGWTLSPATLYEGGKDKAPNMYARMKEENFKKMGFVQEGDFMFAAHKHDTGAKKVLGTSFPAGGGYEEGLQLIHLLASHPNTARFLSTKLAVRFVSDTPPATLIDKMARTFLEQQGDIRQVLATMVAAPEFWAPAALREKTKSPFELAISSVRSLDADVQAPYQLYTWITRMGEKMYFYQAPTGFPDRGQYWINTGSLLNRMNFGLALASQRIPGIRFDLAALNHNREPESAEAALLTYSRHLMPERNLEETIRRLSPTLQDPNFGRKVDAAAQKTAGAEPAEMSQEMSQEMGRDSRKAKKTQQQLKNKKNLGDQQDAAGNNTMLAQVVGIIIGSPEFQRK